MENFAPVLIATLNRYEHFKKCIESLSKCKYADKTDLYIAFDYPLNESHWAGYKKIEGYLAQIKGFKTVIIIKRDVNYGVRKNYNEARNTIFNNYDRIIISEDDNVFSIDFLSFVNKGLDIYKDRKDIFSINGYNYPIIIPRNYKNDIYVWRGFSAWGYGTWKEKWEKVDWNYSGLKAFLENKQNLKKLNGIAECYVPALRRILETGYVTGDTLICYHQIINNMLSVYPVVSRVRNIGHDGSGINCSYMESDLYRKQVIYTGSDSYNLPHDIKPNEEINRILKKHFRISFKSKIKTAAKLLLKDAGFYNTSK